ncbi:MAG: hypothetical protein AAFR81_10765 [Chloroflexota bacterium]
MSDKQKNDKKKSKYNWLINLFVIVSAVFFCNMSLFRGLLGESNDPVERLTTHFEIILDEATDLHYRSNFDLRMNLRTVLRYTVPNGRVDSSLSNTFHECLLVEREANFMPEFANLSNVEWWTPTQATTFEGATCVDDENSTTITYHILVDYTDDGLATTYIEQE